MSNVVLRNSGKSLAATPSASDSHRSAFWHRYYSVSFHDFSTELDFTNPVGLANPTKQCESLAEGVASE